MVNLSDAVSFLSDKFPGSISREAVSALVSENKITFDAAANVMGNLEAHGLDGSRSNEAKAAIDNYDDVDELNGVKAATAFYKDVKFKAMLDSCKKDDTMLYTEFMNIEKARERIAAEIVAKEENNFNMLLNQIKDTTGTNKDLFDKLIGVNLSVDKAFE